MDDFKIRSIDEFDADFINSRLSTQATPDEPAENSKPFSSDGNEINKGREYAPEDEVYSSAQNAAAAQNPYEQYKPAGSDAPSSMPYEPLTKGEGLHVDKLKFPFNDADEDDEKSKRRKPAAKKPNSKKSKGKTAGKAICIILLAATVLAFVMGCFVAIFVDNSGVSIGKYNLSTVNSATPAFNLSKGDLVISKMPGDEAYGIDDLVAVRKAGGNGCELGLIKLISTGTDNTVTGLTVMSAVDGVSQTIAAEESAGMVLYYVPAAGTLIRFAMDNIILVCVLFVLLVALWCLVLILIEKPGSNPDSKKK
ncbi:MAG: hypothetical protein K6B52_00465 [Clostridiales bacterium]|nr:hypothetical protein [Clostridiales bacterium]